MTNSKIKGKKGELEIAHYLQDQGYDSHRGQQYCGSNGDADVIGVPGLHIEVKRTEKCHPYVYLDQAKKDARNDETPIVVHRQSRKPWIVIMDMDDFFRVWKEARGTKKPD